MFEALLEKILLSYFGKFITGLDKNNLHLGVWKGDVVIENVNIKPEVMDMLDIPLIIFFSNLGKMQLKVPWSKLSSSPVEIILEDLFMVIGPKERKEWNFEDQQTVQKKLELIQKYAQGCLDKFIQKLKKKESAKPDKDEQGYIDKMTMKIIDNIQLTIRNIHIRWEENEHYSFGITLSEIVIQTTDDQGKKAFVDRTEGKNVNVPINKLLSLNNLAIYWNANETEFVNQRVQDKSFVIEFLKKLIVCQKAINADNKELQLQTQPAATINEQKSQYIINISAELKLILNPEKQFNLPLYSLFVELNVIDLNLQHDQLQQIIRIIETVIIFNKMLWITRKKAVDLNESEKLFHKSKFVSLFSKIQRSEQQNLAVLNEEELEVFENTLKAVNYDTLFEWVKIVVKDLVKEEKLSELEKKKKKKKKKWFGSSTNESQEYQEITEEEVKQLEDYIDTQFEQEEKNFQDIVRPPDSVWLAMNFKLEGGSIMFAKKFQTKEEAIKFQYIELNLFMQTAQDNSFEMYFNMKDIKFDMITIEGELNQQQPKVENVLMRNQKVKQSSEQVFKYIYKRHAIGKDEHEDAQIICSLEPMEFYYSSEFVRRFGDFFDVETEGEYLKSRTMDKFDQIQETTEENLKQMINNAFKLTININIGNQKLYIPFPQGQWTLEVNSLDFNSLGFEEKEVFVYEMYQLQIKRINLLYSSSKIPIFQMKKSDALKVIDNYEINANIKKMKRMPNINQIQDKAPYFCTEAALPDLCIHFSEENYNHFMNLPRLIFPNYDENNLERQLLAKQLVLKNKTKSGFLKKLGNNYKFWVEYYAVLSRNYLYLYENQNDLKYQHKVFIKSMQVQVKEQQQQQQQISQEKQEEQPNCEEKKLEGQASQDQQQHLQEPEIQQQKSQQLTILYPFELSNKQMVWSFASSSIEERDNWVQLLSEKITEYNQMKTLFDIQDDQNIENDPSAQKQKQNSTQSILKQISQQRRFRFFIQLPQLQLILDQNNGKKLFDISLKGLEFEKDRKFTGQTMNYSYLILRLNSLLVSDNLYQYKNNNYQCILSSFIPQLEKKLEEDNQNQNKNQPLFEMQVIKLDEVQLNLKFNTIYCNWKPDVILKLIDLLKVFRKKYQLQEKDVELKQKGGNINNQQIVSEIINNQYYKDQQQSYDKSDYKVKNRQKDLIAYDREERSFLKIKIELAEAYFNLIHWQTHAGLAQLRVKQSEIRVFLTNEKLFVEGTVDDCTLLDLTSYPDTKNSNNEEEQNHNVRGFQILGKRTKNQNLSEKKQQPTPALSKVRHEDQGSLDELNFCEFKFAKYDEKMFVNNERVVSFLDLGFKNMVFIYQHQPIMRMIDYVMNQIIFLLLCPQFLTLNNDYSLKKAQADHYTPRKVVGELEDLVKYCLCPTFIDIRVHIDDVELRIPPWPNDKQYYYVKLDSVECINQQVQSTRRLLRKTNYGNSSVKEINSLWHDQYVITAFNACIGFQGSDGCHQLAKPVKLNLIWERLMFYNDLIFIWPQLTGEIDNNFTIWGALSPLTMKISRPQYQQLVKMINHNFAYDDQKDQLFIHDWEVVSTFSPPVIELTLDIVEANLNIFPEYDSKIPMANLQLEQLRLFWHKDEDEIQISLFGKTIRMNQVYSEEGYNHVLDVNEICFVGSDICTQKPVHLDDIEASIKNYHELQQKQSEFSMFAFPNFSEKDNQLIFKTLIQMKTRIKDITLTFMQVKLLANTQIYIQSFLWGLLEDYVWPPNDDPFTKPRITFVWEIKSAIVVFPTTQRSSVFATRGDITFIFRRKGEINLALQRQLSNSGDRSYPQQQTQTKSISDVYTYSVTLTDLEVFKCKLANIVQASSLNQVPKMNLILPFSCHWTMKEELCFGPPPQNDMYYVNKIECSIESFVIKISYRDLLLTKSIVDYQQHEFKRLEEEKEKQEKLKVHSMQEQQPQKEAKQINSNLACNIIANGLQIYIINDIGKSSVPVLQTRLYESQFIINKTSYKMIFSALLQLSFLYYNSKISKWEPIIERTAVDFDYSFNSVSSPRNYIVLQLNHNYQTLNINLSKEMIHVLWRTFRQWKEQFDQLYNINSQQQKQQQQHDYKNMLKIISSEPLQMESHLVKKQSDYKILETISKYANLVDDIEYVSPYVIKNECGYPIEIKDSQKTYLIAVSQEMSYRMPSDSYYQHQIPIYSYSGDDEEAILNLKDKNKVSINVVHPKYHLSLVQNVNLDQNKTKQVALSKINEKHNSFMLVLENKVEQKSRKVLLVRSNLKLVNKTRFDLEFLQIHFVEDRGEKMQFTVPQMTHYYLPFDKTQNLISFRFKNEKNQAFSELIDLRKMLETQPASEEETSYEIPHSASCFTVIKIKKDKINYQNLLIFQQVFTIKNCLPIPLQYSMISEPPPQQAQPLVLQQVQSIQQSQQQQQIDQQKVITGLIQSQDEVQFTDVSLNYKTQLKIKIQGFQNSDWIAFIDPKYIDKFPQYLTLCDYRGNKGFVDLAVTNNKYGSKTFYIFARAYFVNETPFDFFYFCQIKDERIKDDRFRFLPGQKILGLSEAEEFQDQYYSRITLLGAHTSFMIDFNEGLYFPSEAVQITGIGQHNLQLKLPQKNEAPALFEFGVDLSILCIDAEKQLFSKVVQISPKYIVMNETKMDLHISQTGCEDKLQIIIPGKRMPFNWSNITKPKQIIVKLVDNDSTYGWSRPITLKQNLISFILRDAENDVKFMRMELVQDSSNNCLFIMIQECINNENAVYIIENKLKQAKVKLFQSCFLEQILAAGQQLEIEEEKNKGKQYQQLLKNVIFCVPEMKTQQFALEEPDGDKEIVVEVKFNNSDEYKMKNIVINLNDVDVEREYLVASQTDPQDGNKIYKFYVCLRYDQNVKKILFYEQEGLHQRFKLEEKLNLQLNINFDQLTLSLITYSSHNKDSNQIPGRFELALVTIREIDIVMLETMATRTFHTKVQHLCVDNNLSYNAHFPVCLIPKTEYKPPQVQLEEEQQIQQLPPFISFLFDQNIQSKELNVIRNIKCSVQPAYLKLTDQFLEQLLEFGQEFQKLRQQDKDQDREQSSSSSSNQSFLFKNKKIVEMKWQSVVLLKNKSLNYVKEIELYPVELNFSFKKVPRSQILPANLLQQNHSEDSVLLKNVFNAIGIVVQNIDNATINLKGIKILNCLDYEQGIFQKLKQQYKDNLVNSLFEVIGSINIIGNPIGLLKNIGTGVYDLIDMPAQGFVQGPLEGGLGVIRGTGSLIKKTISGTFNSVYNITDSLASGFSTLAFDREKLSTKQANDAVEGVGLGLQSLLQGVEEGLVGLVKKPVEGAQQGGVGGFLKGTMKGIAGLVFKPVTGAIDLASKTAEGIKNTANIFDKENHYNKRQRIPRAFYGKDRSYRGYSQKDSELLLFFQTFKNGRFAAITFEEALLITLVNNEQGVLILGQEWILLLNVKQKQLIWEIDTKYLLRIEKVDQGIIINKSKDEKGLAKETQIFIQVIDVRIKNSLCDKLKSLQNSIFEF